MCKVSGVYIYLYTVDFFPSIFLNIFFLLNVSIDLLKHFHYF